MDMKKKLSDGDVDGELYGNQLLIPERMAAARPGGVIRMTDVIQRIIARDNLELPKSPFARMLAPPTPQRAGPSGLDAHMPLFGRRVDSSDEKYPDRPVWLSRSQHMEFDDGDYEPVENVEKVPPFCRKRAERHATPFINADVGVDGDATNDTESYDDNDDLGGFIVADKIEY